jgi:23S rRNA pseudouridine1911/1915/1917 synthase
MARRVQFIHPVSGVEIDVTAPIPANDNLWQALAQGVK